MGIEDQAQPTLVAAAWQLFDATAADWLLGVSGDAQLVREAGRALAAGCESPSLQTLAALRGPDADVELTSIYGACRERDVEFPLKADAIWISVRHLLSRMVQGSVSPRQASVKLWTLADRDEDQLLPELQNFKHLAISMDLAEDPYCDFELDMHQWTSEMLSLADQVLSGPSTPAAARVWTDRSERHGA
jgi:hypothetical protein